MSIDLLLLIIWAIIGVVNLISQKINKISYFCCWAVLIIELLQDLL